MTPEPLASFSVGDGTRTTVLLHGFLGSGKNLRTVALRWAARDPRRRFLLPDLRGHGDSPALRADDDIHSLAADVLCTIDADASSAPFSIIGHSLGGRIALAAAALAPGRVADVAMLDISPMPIDPELSASRRVLDVIRHAPDRVDDRRQMRALLVERGLSPALSDWLLMNLRSDGDGYVWRVDRAAMDRLHERFTRVDLTGLLRAPGVAVRCIRGGRSPYVSHADAVRLEAAGVRVDTLPDAGHFLHVDALEPLLDLMTDGTA